MIREPTSSPTPPLPVEPLRRSPTEPPETGGENRTTTGPHVPAGLKPMQNRTGHARVRTYIKWTIVGLAGSAAVLALVLAWMPKPVVVDLALVDRGPLEVTVDEDGRTRVKDRFVVSAPLAGTLLRPALHAGDTVRQGQVVARLAPLVSPLLDPRSRSEAEARVSAAEAALAQARTAIPRARAALDFARQDARRRRALFQGGAMSAEETERAELQERTRSEELASAEFGFRVAEAELRQARAALGQLDAGAGTEFVVRSPVHGRVLRLFQESEAPMSVGASILEIGDPSALEVVVDVLTADAVDIRPGVPVRIEQWGGETALAGHVHRVEPSAFTRISALGVEEQRTNVIVDLDDPPDRWAGLADGFRVESRIVVWRAADIVRVPTGAVFRHGQDWAVYVVSDGRARLKVVEMGRRNAAQAQVLGGLNVGDVVVVYPGDDVVDGARVAAR
jgi:HlyD family secretion protein